MNSEIYRKAAKLTENNDIADGSYSCWNIIDACKLTLSHPDPFEVTKYVDIYDLDGKTFWHPTECGQDHGTNLGEIKLTRCIALDLFAEMIECGDL